MRIYQLTDRDFEEFFALMEKIEAESTVKHGNGPVVGHTYILEETRRTYRYHFISWRNRVMSGDTMHRDAEQPTTNWLKNEIERLQRMLPKEAQ